MTPAELLDDHRRRPRQLGKLLNPSATGDVGSIVVGDALRLYLKIDGDPARIVEARFQVFNATDQVAPASALCELLAGWTLADAKTAGAAAIRKHLGGLAADELPPLIWAVSALGSAITAWEHAPEREGDEEREALFCRCHGIPAAVVRESIRLMQLTEPEQVVDATGVGTGCGTCRADLPAAIAEAQESAKPKPVAPPAPRTGPTGRIAQVHRIAKILTDDVHVPGIELEPWDLGDQRLVVRLRGTGDRAAALAKAGQVLGDRLGGTWAVEAAE